MEVRSLEEFLEIASRAVECRVKKSKDVVKFKARAKRYLYTLKVPADKEGEVREKVSEKCAKLVEV
ncbi:MAG: 60S ribosomal protein L38 [Aeropyrum sp.]|nr:60S ribosomal protein L38 [Aeropyrum sp.]MCE4616333.1 60S ribosomal protein L38 [Aeropyrum sp.]